MPVSKGDRLNPRILFVEDSADDAELMLRRLREAGIEPQWDRVATEAALREALAAERWELALVDYNLPGFAGPTALSVLAEEAPDVPAITVSGAVDYVLKDSLTRLAPAVRRAVEGAELRRRQRRAAEAARLALFAVDHASLSIMTVAADGTIIYVNDFACDEFGASREEIVGAKLWDYDDWVSAAEWPERWEALKQSRVLEFEVERGRSAERRRVIEVTANYLEGAECLISYGRDITARRLAEEQAHASERMYRRIVELAEEGIWAIDDKERTAFVNSQMAEILGYETEEMLGHVVTDFLFAEDLDDHVERMSERRRGQQGRYQRRFKRKDGSEVWTEASVVAELGPDGRLLGTFGMFTDISERKRAVDALRESEDRFEEFADHFPGHLFMQDEERRYVYVNQHEAKNGDVPSEEWLGKTPSQVWEAAIALGTEANVQRALDGEVVDIVELWEAPGFREHLHSIYFPIPRSGKPPLVGGISIDVTQLVDAEGEVRRQAEQLRRTVEGAVLAMSHVVETRDPYTAGHERRVAELSTAIAAEMGMDGEDLTALRLAGLIHDIGKVAVPAEILSKPGRLSAVEFDLIKQHAQTGFDILAAIDFGQPVAEMVLQHHERLDGSGYPRGLSAAEILPEARILAVADVVEAMSSHRPYRAALGMEAALAEIREHAGVRYDADVAAACFRVVEEQGFQFSM
jgi:PAS domain S-box-containing protein/putative nucleotidyltransferase with HDIG domain